MKRAASVVLSLIAAGAACLSLAGAAAAFPSATPNAEEGAARLDALLKPPFGALIHPKLRRYHRPEWAGRWGGGYYGYGDGYYGGGGGGYYGGGYDPCAPGYGGGGGYVDGGYQGGGYPGAYQGGGYPTGPGSGGGYILDGHYVSVGGPSPGYGAPGYGGAPYGGQPGCQGGYVDGGYPGGGYVSGGYPGGGYVDGGYPVASGYPGGGEIIGGQPSWGWNPSADISTWGPPQIYALGGGDDHVTVDCRDQSGPRLNSALARLAPGGTLYLRGRGPACEESLQIQQPVIIAGEPPAAFPIGGDPGQAVIKAPPGQPCAVIAVGPRGGVEFRDVTLEAPHGGSSPCIQSWGSAVAMVRSTIHHNGEASAIYASGGQLFFSDAEIDGVSDDSTIWVEDAAVVFKNVGVTGVSTALDIRPGGANAVLLDHVTLYAPPGEASHTATGFLVRKSRSLNDHFELHHVQISGFRNGVVAERGVDLRIDHTLINHSRLGVAVDGGHVDIHDSGIDASDWGVYAYAGQVTISRTHIFSFSRSPIGSDPGASIDDHGHLAVRRPLRRVRSRQLVVPRPPLARLRVSAKRFPHPPLGLGIGPSRFPWGVRRRGSP